MWVEGWRGGGGMCGVTLSLSIVTQRERNRTLTIHFNRYQISRIPSLVLSCLPLVYGFEYMFVVYSSIRTIKRTDIISN